MTNESKIITRPMNVALLGKRMLLGGGIALILIVIFLFPVFGQPHPADWGTLWMIRPLVVVSLAGATGGACFHIMDHLSYEGGWRKTLAYALSFIIFMIGLWLGSVLGLAGTMWH